MNPEQNSRRRFINAAAMTMGGLGLQACGGGGGAGSDSALQADAAAAANSEALRVVRPLPPPAAKAVITTLTVNSTADGSRSFAASVFPLEGQVPAGSTLASPDDGTLTCSVLTRWNDGSAALMVVAGTSLAPKGQTATMRLQLSSTADSRVGTLTTDTVAKAVRSVKLDLGVLGTVEQTNFQAPERIWWANAQVICARYRLRAPNHATLEGLVDVHAYADGRAFVEIVIENARIDSVAPARPVDATYDGKAYVNGVLAGSARSADAPEGTHSAFRAWYASSWIGGNPGLLASQTVADLQKHPLLFKMDQAAGDLSVYATDTYVPWGAGRHRADYMGGAGDHPSIGPLTQWDAAFLQSGSPAAAAAVEASALSALGFNVVYRDAATGLVPNQAMLIGRQRGANYPATNNPNSVRSWEVAHHPAVGLIAFAARPSPIHIETAQRIVVWNATWSAGGTGSSNLSAYKGADFATDSTGVFGYYYQPRGRAWCFRSLVHATFLSPDASTWKAGGRRWMDMNRAYLSEWMKNRVSTGLGFMLGNGPSEYEQLPPSGAAFQWPTWQTHFMIPELHRAAAAKLLSGASQTAMEELANWAAEFPVRWINEQPNGGWRYIPYIQLYCSDANGMPLPTWGQTMAVINQTKPPTVAGGWNTTPWVTVEYEAFFGDSQAGGSAGYYYVSVYWAALVAAVERGVPGAATAWATVQNNVTTLNWWRAGFANNARFGATPRRIGNAAI